jgi:predicted Zn-dependent protease
VWIGKRRGSAATTDVSDAALKQAVEDAQTFAKLAPVDREYPAYAAAADGVGRGLCRGVTARVDPPARARQIATRLRSRRRPASSARVFTR